MLAHRHVSTSEDRSMIDSLCSILLSNPDDENATLDVLFPKHLNSEDVKDLELLAELGYLD